MIDSQPSASRPRNPRLVARRLMPRREPVVRRELVESTGWNNVRIEHEPDTAVTHPLPTRALPPTRVLPLVDSEPSAASFTPVVMHARSTELSVVALLSAVVTFGAVLFAQHAAHWGEARAQISEPRAPRQIAEQSERPMTTHAALSPSWAATLTSNIPVVLLRDLPLEHGAGARIEYERPAAAPRAEVERNTTARVSTRASRPAAVSAAPGPADRAELARALARAGAAARSCGDGPVHAQIVATFAPSGVPSSVHFGGSAPPASMRSCVLSAVARTRVTAFVGEPVTVSKSLSW
ncbi:MAG: hypothetical protein WDO69_04635 [Pseudomonadota bacterium]